MIVTKKNTSPQKLEGTLDHNNQEEHQYHDD